MLHTSSHTELPHRVLPLLSLVLWYYGACGVRFRSAKGPSVYCSSQSTTWRLFSTATYHFSLEPRTSLFSLVYPNVNRNVTHQKNTFQFLIRAVYMKIEMDQAPLFLSIRAVHAVALQQTWGATTFPIISLCIKNTCPFFLPLLVLKILYKKNHKLEGKISSAISHNSA